MLSVWNHVKGGHSMNISLCAWHIVINALPCASIMPLSQWSVHWLINHNMPCKGKRVNDNMPCAWSIILTLTKCSRLCFNHIWLFLLVTKILYFHFSLDYCAAMSTRVKRKPAKYADEEDPPPRPKVPKTPKTPAADPSPTPTPKPAPTSDTKPAPTSVTKPAPSVTKPTPTSSAKSTPTPRKGASGTPKSTPKQSQKKSPKEKGEKKSPKEKGEKKADKDASKAHRSCEKSRCPAKFPQCFAKASVRWVQE